MAKDHAVFLAAEIDRHQIETATAGQAAAVVGHPDPGQSAQTLQLALVNPELGRGRAVTAPQLHLNKDKQIAPAHHQVDLTSGAPEPAAQTSVPAFLQKLLGDRLCPFPHDMTVRHFEPAGGRNFLSTSGAAIGRSGPEKNEEPYRHVCSVHWARTESQVQKSCPWSSSAIGL